MKVHELKIDKKYYDDVVNFKKTFEIRYNDRDYKVDDVLKLQEYSNGEYTGRYVYVVVTYLLDDETYLQKGYVCMSICLVNYE